MSALALSIVESGAAYKWSCIWEYEWGSSTVYDVLFARQWEDSDARRLVIAALVKCVDWDFEFDLPHGWTILFDGALREFAPTLGVMTKVHDGQRLAAIVSGAVEGGRSSTIVDEQGIARSISCVREASDVAHHWRNVLKIEGGSRLDLEFAAKRAFPNLVFSEGFFGQFGRLQGDRRENRLKVFAHLEVLSDYGTLIWAQWTQAHERIAAMGSRGVTCSPESSGTRSQSGKMDQRRVFFGDREVLCEWHTKLEPNRNRIHFSIENGAVFVGRMVGHLPT
ncbi:hypothetical protein [Oerskovia enterophila]|uniref:hypothetical protein n=1 Tax=Oerskovia enterophila TaxID=43678 RepID=UPI00380D685F